MTNLEWADTYRAFFDFKKTAEKHNIIRHDTWDYLESLVMEAKPYDESKRD